MKIRVRKYSSIIFTGIMIVVLSSCNVISGYQSIALTLTMAKYFAATPSITPPANVTIIPSSGDLGWGQVYGVIIDANTNQPLAGIEVRCEQYTYIAGYPCAGITTTDANGVYSFGPVFFHDSDTIKLIVEAPGYEPLEFTDGPFTRPDAQINLGLFPLSSNSITWTPPPMPVCSPPPCSNGQLACGSADGCPGGCGTVCKPSYVCTPPVCEEGNLVCGSPDGCPGGCGTICQMPSPTPQGTVIFDFASQLCSAQWMNGGQSLTACPAENADHSGGVAELTDPVSKGLPAGTLALRTIPAWNGYSSLFLRYPPMTINADDHFQATLLCDASILPCDVQFALEYYDSNGKFHSPFMAWNITNNDAPLYVDVRLNELAGQKVDLVLTLRVFHALNTPEQDNGIWGAPRIFRPLQ